MTLLPLQELIVILSEFITLSANIILFDKLTICVPTSLESNSSLLGSLSFVEYFPQSLLSLFNLLLSSGCLSKKWGSLGCFIQNLLLFQSWLLACGLLCCTRSNLLLGLFLAWRYTTRLIQSFKALMTIKGWYINLLSHGCILIAWIHLELPQCCLA